MKKKTKIIISIVAFLSVVAVALLITFTLSNNTKAPENTDNQGVFEGVTDGNGNELDINKVHDMPEQIVFRTAGVISETDYDAITVKATVKPDNATNKKLDWEAVYVDSANEWATGKKVSDYVTVTPESDGASTATIRCLKPFGAQIKIKVTSRSNANATAECTVDFAKRIDHLTVNGETNPEGLTLDYVACSEIPTATNITPTAMYTDFTVDDEFQVSYYRKYSQAFLDKIEEKYPDVNFRDSIGRDYDWTVYSKDNSILTWTSNLFTTPIGGILSVSNYDNYYETVKNILLDNPDIGYFVTYKVEYVGTYSTYVYELGLKFDADSLFFEVASVTLDKTTVIV